MQCIAGKCVCANHGYNHMDLSYLIFEPCKKYDKNGNKYTQRKMGLLDFIDLLKNGSIKIILK